MRTVSRVSPAISAVVLSSLMISWTGMGAEAAWPPVKARLGLLKDATSLCGKKVKDADERNVGVIEDLLLNLTNGQVLATLVASSKGGERVLVPAQAYFTVTKDRAVVRVDHKQIDSAPRIPTGISLAKLDLGRLNQSFQHFELPPVPAGALESDHFCSGLAVVGSPVMGENDEPLGRVADFMADLVVGELVYLVVDPGSGNELYPVPPGLVRPSPTGQRLVLRTNKAQFLAGPHFQREFWTEMALPSMANAVGKHYGLVASVASEARPGVRSDQEITGAVLSEIVRVFRGTQALNIAVRAADGRVTLSGLVRNEKQEKQIVEAAERVVGAANVENQLVVSGKPRTSSR